MYMQYQNGKMRTSEGGGGGGSSTFSGLEDVSFSNLQNGQIAKYNSTEEKWENEENSLANLSDTSMLTLSDKQVLSYNGRTQKWENKSNSVSRLSDVSLNSPSDGDILRYNAQSGEWENAVMPDTYHVYSTTEHIVGEWTDGKPIYEITKSVDTGSSTSASIQLDTHIDDIISIIGRNLQSNGNIVAVNYYGDSSDKANCYFRKSDYTLQIRAGASYGKGVYTVTIQYTKTTAQGE